MGRKPKVSSEVKLQAVMKYMNSEGSYYSIASIYGVDPNTIRAWVKKYESMGAEGLSTKSTNKYYSASFKEQVVKAYLNGEGSYHDLSKIYKIPSNRTIINWVLKYNSHETLKSSGTGGTNIMTTGKKTTLNERIEIIEYCIENEYNYAKTAEKYEVSYQQVYSWVKKYNKKGLEGLQDRRGKHKAESELTEIEKLKAQNKLLQAENRKKQIEIDFLKKLEEIERRRS